MVRLLQIASVLSLALAAGVLTLCIRLWLQVDAAGDSAPASLEARSVFLSGESRIHAAQACDLPPLIAAAEKLATYLKPPPPPVQETPPIQKTRVAEATPAPAVQPPADTPKFTLRGTICCTDQPERSLALICELGANDGGHWVRQGAQLGHFVIQEVHPGSVVCRAGKRLCKMAVEREAERQLAAAPETRPAANNACPASPAGSPKRPRAVDPIAVGSPRTAALN